MEPWKFFSGSWEDQRIIFRDQGSTDHPPPPPWGPRLFERVIINFQALTDRANHWGNWLKDNSFLMYEPVSDWTARTVQDARIMAHIMFLLN